MDLSFFIEKPHRLLGGAEMLRPSFWFVKPRCKDFSKSLQSVFPSFTSRQQAQTDMVGLACCFH
jgi:hypothetical protein